MATDEREAWVAKALELVPKEGSLCQGAFYGTLAMWLKNGVSERPEHPTWTVRQTVERAVEDSGCQIALYDERLLTLDWPNELS
jgi:hypothetical protein